MLKFFLKNILIKVNLKDLKKIRSFSVLFVPTRGGIETKSRQFSSSTVLLVAGIYSLALLFLGFLIFNLTPLRGLIFPGSSSLSLSEKQLVIELNQRMIYLTKELENLKSTNEQLKNAIMLGDSSLIDSLTNKVNQKRQKNNPYGGDVLSVINFLFDRNDLSQKELIHFTSPSNGYISRGFSPDNGHMGIDIVVKIGTPVYASSGGYVIFADYTVRDGYMMILAHSDGYITVYKHCSVLMKKTRDFVFEGELIALSGNTGEITTGPHLHFEIWKDGKPINPQNLLITN